MSHASSGGAEEARKVFDADYTLGTIESISDIVRAQKYAAAIAGLGAAAHAGRILEVGCGAGLVLKELAAIWPEAAFVGLEAAPRLARKTSEPRILIRHEFVEDMPADKYGFDLIYAINVLEHAADPRRFLQSMARQISSNGMAILICPDAAIPNLELLFSDHVHSFTVKSLMHFARDSGLDLTVWEEGPLQFEDFRIYGLSPSGQRAPSPLRTVSFLKFHELRTEYLSQWSKLDSQLLERARKAHQVFAFGAGETAALLRAYAPTFWSRVDALVVDQPLVPNWLDKQVMSVASLRPSPQQTFVLAVHPRNQKHIAARLRAEGFDVVRWDQDIPR